MADTPRTPESLLSDALHQACVAMFPEGAPISLHRASHHDGDALDLLAHAPLAETLARGLAAEGLVVLLHELADDPVTMATDPDGECFFCGDTTDLPEHDEDSDCIVARIRAALAQTPEATDA